MTRFLSIITFLILTWTSLVQAFPIPEFDFPSLTNHQLSTIHNNGDIGKTVESLGSKETLKSITTAMLMAGLTGGGTPSTFMGHVSQQTANALYRIGIESAVYGRADGKGVALSAVAGAIGGKLSAEIGTLNSAGEIGFFTHKVMHALNGAGQGLIVGGEKGMAAGALGATLAVTVAEVMMPTNGIASMDPKDRPVYTEAEIQKAQAVSRVVAAMVALGVGMEASDVSIAIMAAITAVDHNCAKSARKAKGYLGVEGTDTETHDGYESDTSLSLKAQQNEALKALEAYEAKGEKPSFRAILKYLKTTEAYEARRENMSGNRFTSHMLKEVAQDIYQNWQSYGLAIAESLPAGIGTTVTVGHEGYDVLQGDQTIPGAAGVLATDAAIGFVGGKVLSIVGRALTKVGGFAKGFYHGAGRSVHVQTPKLPKELRTYIREVETKSGLPVHPTQRELLAADLRQNAYSKLEPTDYAAHAKQYKPEVRDRLITEWEKNTGQTWPTYTEDIIGKSGNPARYAGNRFDAHHINPQELGGKNEWWNMHPVPFPDHQRFVHGANSQLTQIIKGAK